MNRHYAGRVALVVGLAVALVSCGWYGSLQARKAFKEANVLYQQQDYKRAAEHYENVLKADPNLTAAYFYLANSYDQLYKPARAGEPENDALLQKAVQNYQLAAEREQNPKMKKLALEYLVASYGPDKLNDPDKAEPLIQQMIQLDPTDPANYFALGKMYEDSGRYDEAEQIFIKAREAKPDDTGVYMQLAGFYNRQGDFVKTIEALQQRATREPNNPEAHYTIATFYWDKAYRDFRLTDAQKSEYAGKGLQAVDKALQLNKDYVDAIVYKGLLLRVQAAIEKNADRQKQMLKEADALQARAMELKKQKATGVGD